MPTSHDMDDLFGTHSLSVRLRGHHPLVLSAGRSYSPRGGGGVGEERDELGAVGSGHGRCGTPFAVHGGFHGGPGEDLLGQGQAGDGGGEATEGVRVVRSGGGQRGGRGVGGGRGAGVGGGGRLGGAGGGLGGRGAR